MAFRRHDRKRLVHPVIGLVEVNCLNLFSEDGRQRLLWFTPAVGTESAGLLELLSVVGTQEVSEVSAATRTAGSSTRRQG